ncbi:hypothetical protein Ccrd_023953 [Cynara cardunculus var. scolymus]|uniref:DNA-directed DNA polymerase n=1 Tax=Cynara cardunculus var. scolymus TaxID=59895 RepID=A0A103XCV7_CYNCS|nr:hypothetical protein Ccrd_023953 [Cynara cardunculus var. scolymus]
MINCIKKKKVSLRVSTDKRDSKKTEVSTFVNFIHQKDAFIAMKVVEAMLYLKAPVYTVHDTFLTLPYFSQKVADIYSNSVTRIGSPLLIKNRFLYHNVIPPNIEKYYQISKIYEDEWKYEVATIVRVMIRVFMENEKKTVMPSLSDDDRYNLLYSTLKAGLNNSEAITAREISHSKRKHTRHITAIKECQTNLHSFIVSDIETLPENNIHIPYSAGLLIVRPGKDLKDDMIETYYSEHYSLLVKNLEDKGSKVLYDLVLRISAIVQKDNSIRTVFFHNFSRFDGIIVLKHLARHHPQYKLKPLMINNRLYELSVYSGKKMLFCFRDSLNLLPGALRDLAKSLCPALGPKGSLNYNEFSESNLLINKEEYLDYMKQDILLLGGVMQKAQEIYWNLYNMDI